MDIIVPCGVYEARKEPNGRATNYIADGCKLHCLKTKRLGNCRMRHVPCLLTIRSKITWWRDNYEGCIVVMDETEKDIPNNYIDVKEFDVETEVLPIPEENQRAQVSDSSN